MKVVFERRFIMKKINVIYWSDTGNTKMMAKAVADGASSGGSIVSVIEVGKASVDTVTQADVLAFGCPALGSESLDDSEMEPFIESIKDSVHGKTIALFGSYDWGDGEWMRDWEDRMKSYGANLVTDGLIINGTPDEEGLEHCKDLGKMLR